MGGTTHTTTNQDISKFITKNTTSTNLTETNEKLFSNVTNSDYQLHVGNKIIGPEFLFRGSVIEGEECIGPGCPNKLLVNL